MSMRNKGFFISLLAFSLMLASSVSAQEENGFKKFNVREDFTENGFQWFVYW